MHRRLPSAGLAGSLLLITLALACGGAGPPPDPPLVPNTSTEVTPQRVFPLAVGHRWTYRIVRHKKAGMRIALVALRPASSTHIETWTLEVTGTDDAGRYETTLSRVSKAGEELGQTELTLWTDDAGIWFDAGEGKEPAIEMPMPRLALAGERLPCTANYLGGVEGLCMLMPARDVASEVGLVDGIVGRDKDMQAGSRQLLSAALTAGLFISGDRSTTTAAELVDFTPGEPLAEARRGALYDAWRSAGVPSDEQVATQVETLVREHGADAGSFGGILLDNPEHAFAVAREGVSWLPQDQRQPLVRLAMSRIEGEPYLLAQTVELLGSIDGEDREALLSLVDDRRQLGERLIDGEHPAVVELYQPSDMDRVDQAVELAGKHPMNVGTVEELMRVTSHDQYRDRILDAVVANAEPETAGRCVVATLHLYHFKLDERVERYRSVIDAVSDEDKRALIAEYRNHSTQDEVRELLGL